MSVLVKGIELPEKVQVLELHSDGKVFTKKGYLVGEAVELPEKHGRLIDADYVVEKIRHELGIKDISFLYNAEKSVVNQIFHAPTIIEAEGMEE